MCTVATVTHHNTVYTSVDKSRVLSLLYHKLLFKLQISKGTAQVHFLECCVVIGAVTAICKTLHCNAKGVDRMNDKTTTVTLRLRVNNSDYRDLTH